VKFGLLVSIMRSELDRVREVSRKRREWEFVGEWIDDYNNIVRSKDRAKLDFELPDSFVRAALRRSELKFYLSRDRQLRSKRRSFWDRKLSAIRTYVKFGGIAMEEALEYGSFRV
jgi:hypothetical protein